MNVDSSRAAELLRINSDNLKQKCTILSLWLYSIPIDIFVYYIAKHAKVRDREASAIGAKKCIHKIK